MNPLFELVSIDVKPEKDDTYLVITHDGAHVERQYKNGKWLGDNWGYKSYYRPLLPSKTAQEAAARRVKEYITNPTGYGAEVMESAYKDGFKDGVSWQMAQGEQECVHPWAFVQTKCMGEINKCLKCGKDLGAY